MSNTDELASVAGVSALIAWFGRMPTFHDAELRGISLSSTGPSVMQIFAWNMTDKVDEREYFILERHALVTITCAGVTEVSLEDFDTPGIILDMAIFRENGQFVIRWNGSYGVVGELRAKQIAFSLQPETPQQQSTEPSASP